MMKIKILLLAASMLAVGNLRAMDAGAALSVGAVEKEFAELREIFIAQLCAGITTVEYTGNATLTEKIPHLSAFLGEFQARLQALKGVGADGRPAWLKKSKNLKLLIDMGELQSDSGSCVEGQVDRHGTLSIRLFQQFFAEHAGHQIEDWFDQCVGSLQELPQAESVDVSTSSMVVHIYNPMGDADGNMRSGQAAHPAQITDGNMWHVQAADNRSSN